MEKEGSPPDLSLVLSPGMPRGSMFWFQRTTPRRVSLMRERVKTLT